MIGLKENSNGKTGVVYVHCVGFNQWDESVLDYVHWVLVRKRDAAIPACEPVPPDLPDFVDATGLIIPEGLDMPGFDTTFLGSSMIWDDYEIGEKMDHLDSITFEGPDPRLATR